LDFEFDVESEIMRFSHFTVRAPNDEVIVISHTKEIQGLAKVLLFALGSM
jgi:hypothetical protein